jgi:hypothetical protein
VIFFNWFDYYFEHRCFNNCNKVYLYVFYKFLHVKKNPNVCVCSEDPVTGECMTPRRVSRALLVVSAISLLVLWPLAAISLFASGLAQGPFLTGYAFANADRKQWWRWLVLAISGLGILLFSLVDAVNLDIDGFFELLILGAIGPAIGHTMITTVVGPLIFGRVLCGWGCWRAMVLERLPVGKGSGWRKGVLGLDAACRCGG